MKVVSRCCLALLALAACGGEGVALEVSPGLTGATRVELFVMDQPCDDCAQGVYAPRVALAPALFPGDVYVRTHPAPFAADVRADGRAHFELQPGTLHTVSLIAAVGYANDTVVGVQRIAQTFDTQDEPVRLQTTLEAPVATTLAETPEREGLRVQVSRGADGSGCLALDRWASEGASVVEEGTRVFSVPAEDRSCGVRPDGCEVVTSTQCVASDGERCLVGTQISCADANGVVTTQPCDATTASPEVCVPQRLCAGAGCTGSNDPACVITQLGISPSITCRLPTRINGGAVEVCDSRGSVAPFGVMLNPPCDASFREIDNGALQPEALFIEGEGSRVALDETGCSPVFAATPGNFRGGSFRPAVLATQHPAGRAALIPIRFSLGMPAGNQCVPGLLISCTVEAGDPSLSRCQP